MRQLFIDHNNFRCTNGKLSTDMGGAMRLIYPITWPFKFYRPMTPSEGGVLLF